MVIANANQIGNYNLLNSKCRSVRIMGMRGIRIASPSKGPVKIVASIRFSIVLFFFTASRVPLQSFGGLIF